MSDPHTNPQRLCGCQLCDLQRRVSAIEDRASIRGLDMEGRLTQLSEQIAALALSLVERSAVPSPKPPAPGDPEYLRLYRLFDKSQVVWPAVAMPAGDGLLGLVEPGAWSGTVTALEELLRSEGSRLSPEEKKAVPSANKIGKLLSAARAAWGSEVADARRTRVDGRKWRVIRIPGLLTNTNGQR